MGLLGERKKKNAKGLHVNIDFFPLTRVVYCDSNFSLFFPCRLWIIIHVHIYVIYCPFKALAEGSLSLARAHAVLDETEKSLEHEIERESRKPPKSEIGKYVL